MRGSPYTNLNRPPLREAALRRSLTGPGQYFTDIQVVAETASTNEDVAQAVRDGAADGYVLVAELQTAGRGRLGRTWTSPARAGLTLSVLLRPRVPVARLSWLPLLAGVALAESVGRVAVVDAALKWPNDLLVRSAAAPALDAVRALGGFGKCAGVLAEVIGDGRDQRAAVVLGIGLNVSQRADELPAPPEPVVAVQDEVRATLTGQPDLIAYPATSLSLVGALCADRDPLLRAILRTLGDWYLRWRAVDGDPESSGLREAYRRSCATLGQRIRVNLPDGEIIVGKASDVDIDGRLVIDLGRGVSHRVAAGDVLHVR